MYYRRMPIEVESPEEMGYSTIRYNLAESSVRDISMKEIDLHLDDVLLCYGVHRGDDRLRQLIADGQGNINYGDVLVTASAATALFIIHTTLLDTESHIVVIRPNYATNLETPRATGTQMSIIDLSFENEYKLDIEQIMAACKPNTKLVSITTPHNPTGTVIDEFTIRKLAMHCAESGIYLLVDETYRDLQYYGAATPEYAANFGPNVISVASLSKAYGVPGIRTGWIITGDKFLYEQFLAAKEQIMICNSVLDEAVAIQVLLQKEKIFALVNYQLEEKFEYLTEWIEKSPYVQWVKPSAGVVCFPRIKEEINIDTEKFHSILYKQYSTFVGAGHWFEQAENFMRIGFGYPTLEELKIGLENIHKAIAESLL